MVAWTNEATPRFSERESENEHEKSLSSERERDGRRDIEVASEAHNRVAVAARHRYKRRI